MATRKPPTRYANGLTTYPPEHPLGILGSPFVEPTKWYLHWDDFSPKCGTAHYQVKSAGTPVYGGSTDATYYNSIVIVNSGGGSDYCTLLPKAGTGTTPALSFPALANDAYFETRFRTTNVSAGIAIGGFAQAMTTPALASLRLGVFSASGSATASIGVSDGTNTALVTTTLANDTWYTVGFWYKHERRGGNAYVNGTSIGAAVNSSVAVGVSSFAMGIANNAAAASTLAVDYLLVAIRR
jgi:hypothetical protein